MATVTLIYKLNENGRRASLLAGGTGKHEQYVQIPATPETLALATVRHDGSAHIVACKSATIAPDDRSETTGICNYYTADRGKVGTNYDYGVDYLDAPPTDPLAFALAIPAENARRKAEAEAEAARQREEMRAQHAADLVKGKKLLAEWMTQPHRGASLTYSNGDVALYSGETSGTTERVALDDADKAALAAELEKRKAAWAERDAKKAAEKAEKEQRLIDEREAWIRQHGSPRLQKALVAGLKHGGIYRKERLAKELPGWEYWENGAQEETDHRDVINPEEHETDALLSARAQYPSGDVELWSIFDDETDTEDRVYTTVLAMFCPWSDATVIKRLPAPAST